MSKRTVIGGSYPSSAPPPGSSPQPDAETPVVGPPQQRRLYAFDNAWEQARQRLSALEAWLDPGTVRSLRACGVDAGWTCLEVGGGGGSVATWLCDQVGPTGHVVATDMDPRFLNQIQRTNLEVWHHNVVSDYLPQDAFDLVHTRLVLSHLAEPQSAIHRMIGALKPGGWLVAEELDFATMLALSINDADNRLFTRVVEAHYHVVATRGFDAGYGRRLPVHLQAEKLSPVETECRVAIWKGGSALARVLQLTFLQLHEALTATAGVSEVDLDALDILLDDPAFTIMSQVIVAAWGRRPAA